MTLPDKHALLSVCPPHQASFPSLPCSCQASIPSCLTHITDEQDKHKQWWDSSAALCPMTGRKWADMQPKL